MLTSAEKSRRNWTMACHLSALAVFIAPLPFGNVWGPLIVWLWKRHEIPGVDEHGKAALNFHVSVAFCLLGGAIVLGVPLLALSLIPFLVFITVPLLWLLGILGSGIFVAEVVLTIIAGVKASDGKSFRYPCSLNLIK